MSPFVRKLMATLVACAVAFGIVFLLERLSGQVAPLPKGIDPTNATQLKRAIESGEVPLANLALVLGGWLVAAYVGSTLATRIGHGRLAALMFTVIFTAVTIVNLNSMPHPTWMWIGGAVGVPLVALGAAGESITLRKN